MSGLFGFAILFFFVAYAIVKGSKSTRRIGSIGSIGTANRLAQSGVRGRALVLAASPIAVGKVVGAQRFERRDMTLDVEVPGRAPFVVQGTYLVPRGLAEPIPGSCLEVAVDPRGGEEVVILGPGGFTGPWLNVGPPQPY